MFKANVGYSTNPDSFLSGQETIKKALEGLENPNVALVFSSEEYDQNELVKGIKSVTDIPVIGCTSSEAIITNDGIISELDGQSAAMVFADPDIRIGYSIIERGEDARLAGRKLAIDAIKKSNCSLRPSYIYMLATPGDEESYLKGVQDVVGRVPVFGGSAADNEFQGEWKIFCNDTVIDDGCAIMLIYNKKGINSVYESTFAETGKCGVITKVIDERTIAEIDNEPSLKAYSDWTGYDINIIKGINLLDAAVEYPFGTKDPIDSVTLIRQPIFGNEDQTIEMSNKIVPGTCINLMSSSADDFIDSVDKTLEKLNGKVKGDVGAYLFFHCGKRKYVIDERINEVYEIMKEKTHNRPFIGTFTFGEYGFNDHSANSCGSLMLSFVSIEK